MKFLNVNLSTCYGTHHMLRDLVAMQIIYRHSNIKFTIEFEQSNAISCHTLSKQHFHDIHLPKENFHRSLHEMGFLHSTTVQNKPPLPHLSLISCYHIRGKITVC